MRLRLQELQELQEEEHKAQKLRQQKANGYKKIEDNLHYQSLLFVPETIKTELIRCHHNDLLTGHFSIKKTCKLLTRKYSWLTFRHNVKAYVKGCDIGLASKVVRQKSYSDLQLLSALTHQ